MTDAPQLRRLVAGAEIRDSVQRYCRGIDRLDPELILSAFHADAEIFHGEFSGSPAEFAPWVIARHASRPASQHHITNQLLLRQDDDVADVETYWLSVFTFTCAGPVAERVAFGGGRYLDRFSRRAGDWRISRRTTLVEWRVEADALDPSWPLRPSRSREDPSYRLSQ